MLTLTDCYWMFYELETGGLTIDDLSKLDKSSLRVIYKIASQHQSILSFYGDQERQIRPDGYDPMTITEQQIRDKLTADPMSCSYRHDQRLYRLRMLAFGDSWTFVVLLRLCSKSEIAMYWAYLLCAYGKPEHYATEKEMWVDFAAKIDGSPGKLRKEVTKFYEPYERQNTPDAYKKLCGLDWYFRVEGYEKANDLLISDLKIVRKKMGKVDLRPLKNLPKL